MNGYFCNPGYRHYYQPECPYGETYPISFQCPYCLNRFDGNVYMNNNMGMEYPVNYGYDENPHTNISPMEYGYDNIYPVSDNMYSNVGPGFSDNMSPYYNNLGYINPEENVHSPWDNNRMYTPNENSLPIPKPYN
ncbi:MAG: hypothetical protein GX213_07140 [Clostridiaceae bacterium]|nr:hypothetical protein [Clostridiaceae bacterium]